MTLHLAARSGLVASRAESIPSPATSSVGGQIGAAEGLFSALDGRELKVLGRHWHIEVFSVCELGGCRYVQLALHGDAHYMLTLRVATGTDQRLLIPRLLNWLARPSLTGEILEIG